MLDRNQQESELIFLKNRLHQGIDALFQIIDLHLDAIEYKDQIISQLLDGSPNKFYCPVCNSDLKFFNPLPAMYKKNADKYGHLLFGTGEMTPVSTYSCPRCGASDRERLYAHWIKNQFNRMLFRESEILHFAPEPTLSQWLRQNGFINYKTADLAMDNVDYQVDITALPFSDNTYDFLICSHVLEHVSNDELAMSELFRILKPGGIGIVMVPIAVGLESSIEDPNITDEAERWRLFGQGDHVRLYAHNDYVERLRRKNFIVNEIGINEFGEEVFIKLGLKPTSILYIVQKSI